MIIKKIKLKNIRSYEDEEIIFPEGITLLSGDIGSGKSTILIAMEFALFGFIRNDLSGNSLLRNGKEHGYVMLDFNINNKNVSIKRTLKRNNLNISQDQCFLSINDITKELTSTELKQRIFEMLSYSQDNLTKKSMIYRYTVYTPQEEMKSILTGEKELRLETIRKVFNIDKYKRIKENCRILSSEIRGRKKEYAAYIHDIHDKKDKYIENETKINENNKKLFDLEIKIKNSLDEINLIKINLDNTEKDIKNINHLKKDFEVLLSNIKIKTDTKEKNSVNFEQISNELSNSIEIKEINIEEIKKQMYNIIILIAKKENELKDAIVFTIGLKSKINNSEEIKNKIKNIEKCPLCEQHVSDEHKSIINNREENLINELREKINLYINNEKLIEDEIKNVKLMFEGLKSKENEHIVNKVRIENLKYKKELREKLANEINLINIEIILLEKRKNDIISELDKFKDLEEIYRNYKINLEKLNDNLKKLEIQKASILQENNIIKKMSEELSKEISEKEKINKKLNYYIELHDWLDSIFLNIIDIIEKKVMVNILYNFNVLFQNWFSMLIDSENIKVRLDEEFTPIINQNSYDLEYENLSGGEKTACALAYRLALNQTINNLVLNAATSEIIILDEPTDGFSNEQLDRLRNVLHELKMKQIIVVSHESKIESFVDNIIKLKKESHVSNIV